MERKAYIVSIILIVIVITIIASQVYWIISMYYSYKKEVVIEINKSLEKTIQMEVKERNQEIFGFSEEKLYSKNMDSPRYISKEVISEDSSVVLVSAGPMDTKIIHYLLESEHNSTIDVLRLNELFFQEMNQRKFPVKKTYIEYYDLIKNKLIESSDSESGFGAYIASDMFIFDIMKNKGIKAYVSNPVFIILRGIFFQLLSSVILIIIAIIGLYYLRRTIYRQWREEKMRQDSVNAMTHEFNRPISAALFLMSQMPDYVKNSESAKVSQYIDLTIEELNKMNVYTNRIHQINNDDKSTLSLKKTDIEIRPFMESLLEKYNLPEVRIALGIDEKSFDIPLNINPECKEINADRLHFANVIDNLVENAIKYSGENIDVKISVDFKDNHLHVSVKDSGIGISVYDLERVFDKYYRADHNVVKRNAGFGLGLTYVKSVVESHGGTVEAKSQGVGCGSEFVVLIPESKN